MLTSEQQKDIEQAILDFLDDKGYSKAKASLMEESSFKEAFESYQNSGENLLQRKWLTIIKLQSKIVQLEGQLEEAKEIIAKSVRTIKNPGAQEENHVEGQLKNPTLKLNHCYKGHKDIVNFVALHQTEPVFASGSGDSTIRIYDYELKEQVVVLKGHTHSVNSVSWDAEVLVSGSSDMTVKLWRSANKTNPFDFPEFFCVKSLIGHEHAVSFVYNIHDTQITVSCSRDKTIRFWDRETTYCRRTIDDYHSEWVRCCDANKEYFISSGNDKKLFVFSLQQLLNFEKAGQTDCVNCFEVHDNYVEAVKMYQQKALGDLKTVCFTAARDKLIRGWNFLNGNQLFEFRGHENWVKGLAVLEQYDYLVSIGEDKTIRIWDLLKKKQISVKQNAHDHFIQCMDYNAEFKVLLTGSVDKHSKIWKIVSSSPEDLLEAYATS